MDLNFENVLVTGGAGFIGSHLVEALVAGGCRVTVLDNLSTGSLTNLDSVSDAGANAHIAGYGCAAEDRAEEVKSATYHELEILETDDGFVGRIIFDL